MRQKKKPTSGGKKGGGKKPSTKSLYAPARQDNTAVRQPMRPATMPRVKQGPAKDPIAESIKSMKNAYLKMKKNSKKLNRDAYVSPGTINMLRKKKK